MLLRSVWPHSSNKSSRFFFNVVTEVPHRPRPTCTSNFRPIDRDIDKSCKPVDGYISSALQFFPQTDFCMKDIQAALSCHCGSFTLQSSCILQQQPSSQLMNICKAKHFEWTLVSRHSDSLVATLRSTYLNTLKANLIGWWIWYIYRPTQSIHRLPTVTAWQHRGFSNMMWCDWSEHEFWLLKP